MSTAAKVSPLENRPLGAGDLIDRAVRYYRAYFWTFLLIAAPPIIFGTFVSVAWTLLGHEIFSASARADSSEYYFYKAFLWTGNAVIWFGETIATLMVMGGASRNFVRHLLFNEPITFGETYRNTWSRLAGLAVASTVISVIVGVLGIFIFYVAMIVAFLGIAAVAAVTSFIPVVAVILSIVWGLAVAIGATWLFFLVASRIAYVPQVMLVEGQGVFSAIGRSASLAGGNVKRLAALFVFTTVAAYSALALLYVPLAWYASANGVEVMSFSNDLIPAWYEVAYSLIWQLSLIMLSPVWMIGLCLLYVDERVRGEGYDIELMAAARLGDIPSVPEQYVNPLQPALANAPSPGRAHRSREFTTLGLK
ncbi:MAG: hypothetical protein JO314_11925 [Acidobacteria bacterium]|nr:hypothetical protein [Acidobacteriota bacterium]